MVTVTFSVPEPHHCQALATALEQFTPLAQALRPGMHVFGARGPSRYFGGEQALAELVAHTAGSIASSASTSSSTTTGVGVADGLFASGHAAREAPRRSPNNVLVIPAMQNRQFLADLSLSALGASTSPLHLFVEDLKALLDVLWRLGMRTLGDITALSEADMLGRFGWPGLLAHNLASGLDDRSLQAHPADEAHTVEAEIDPPADRIETVAFTAKTLADKLFLRLQRKGMDCVSINIKAGSDSGHTSNRLWRHEFRFDSAAVTDRVRWQLEGWYRSSQRPTGPVNFVRLTPCEVVPTVGRQLGMWGAWSEADERATKALARLQGLLGAEAVTVPRISGGRRPADKGHRVPLRVTDVAGVLSSTDVTGATGSTDVAGGTNITSSTDVGGVTGVTGVSDITSGTDVADVAGVTGVTGVSDAAGGTHTLTAPWPGQLPVPHPATVLSRPEPIRVTDCDGMPVTVNGRGEASAAPNLFTDSRGQCHKVIYWAGPWPLDERWWHPRKRRRQARFQLVLEDGSAHLCVLEARRWWREATYD